MSFASDNQLAFDLRQAAGSPTGVGRYLLGLANAGARSGIRTRAYVRSELPAGLDASIEVVMVPVRGPRWHLRVWRDLRARPAMYVSTSLVIAQLPGATALPVVLDLTTFLYPAYHTRRTRLAEGTLLPRAVRRWPAVTCTATTSRDLVARFGVTAVSTVVPPALPAPSVHRAAAADPPYVLHVGTLEPRKNVTTALRAVQRLRQDGMDIRLVAAGKVGWHAEALEAELAAGASEGAVEVRGYVTDAERDRLYAEATAVVLPSVYEGFGLPLLEAMARGIPCICSDAPALVEVSGGAAQHVGTLDEDGWASAIRELVGNAALRTVRGDLGLDRAASFGPEQSVAALRQAMDVLEDWVAGRSPRST